MRGSRIGRVAPAAFVLMAASPATLLGQDAGSALFSVNLGLVIWTWILFLLTLGILAWKVFPFISGGLEERQQKIQDAIDEARRARDEAQKMRQEQQAALERSRREAQELVEKARAAGDGLKKEILAEAKVQQAAMLADARRELEAERQQLREDVRREAVEISLAAAERLIRARLDSDENRRLVGEYVSELS